MKRHASIHRLGRADRRAMILRAAKALYAKGGADRMTTAAIAKAAGVTEPILYRHFSSKSGLFRKLLKDTVDAMRSAVKNLAKDAANPADALWRICLGYPKLAHEYEIEFSIINRALASEDDPETRSLLKSHYEAYRALLVHYLRKGQKTGLVRRDIPASTGAWHIIHSALGYLLIRGLNTRGSRSGSFDARLARSLLGGLLTKRNPT